MGIAIGTPRRAPKSQEETIVERTEARTRERGKAGGSLRGRKGE
jgi:hypothetical protein